MPLNLQPGHGSAAPTDTSVYYDAGAVVINNAPSDGEAFAWINSTAGRPGTFSTVGYVGVENVQTITAAGTISVGTRLAHFTVNDNITLAASASHAPGWIVTIYNGGNNTSTCVAATGNTLVGAATVATTLPISWFNEGNGNWIRC